MKTNRVRPLRLRWKTIVRTFFIFVHFLDVFVLSMTWNELFCSCVDDLSNIYLFNRFHHSRESGCPNHNIPYDDECSMLSNRVWLRKRVIHFLPCASKFFCDRGNKDYWYRNIFITPFLVVLHLKGHFITLRVHHYFNMPRHALITALMGILKFASKLPWDIWRLEFCM